MELNKTTHAGDQGPQVVPASHPFEQCILCCLGRAHTAVLSIKNVHIFCCFWRNCVCIEEMFAMALFTCSVQMILEAKRDSSQGFQSDALLCSFSWLHCSSFRLHTTHYCSASDCDTAPCSSLGFTLHTSSPPLTVQKRWLFLPLL